MIVSEFDVINAILSDRLRSDEDFDQWWLTLTDEQKSTAIWVTTNEDIIRTPLWGT